MLWMSVLSGYLAAQLGWRMMFIVEGLPPIPSGSKVRAIEVIVRMSDDKAKR